MWRFIVIMEQVEELLEDPLSTRVPPSSYCSTCFNVPQVHNITDTVHLPSDQTVLRRHLTERGLARSLQELGLKDQQVTVIHKPLLEPPRLEDLALQVSADFIASYRNFMSDINHCQSFEHAIPESNHSDLVKDVTFAILQRHAHEELDWKSTKIGLENFLKCLTDVENEYEKIGDQRPASDEHILSTDGDDSGNQDETNVNILQEYTDEYGLSVSNIYAVSAILFKYMRKHMHSNYSERDWLIENLQKFPEGLPILQRTKQAIQQFLNTGPHICLDERECEFLADLVQQVPRLLADVFTELLGWPLKCATSKDKRMLESLVHPAVTRIQIPAISNEISLHIVCKIVPTLRYLRQIKVAITVTLCDTQRYLNKTEEDLFTSLSISCNLLKELTLHLIPATEEADGEVVLCTLSQKLTQLPASLRLLKCHGSSSTCRVEDLNSMACSERFSSLYCLSLSGMNCNTPLKTGFQCLTVMEIEKFFFESSLFLKEIGSQLRVLSLSFVYMLKFHELAKACPLLQVLTVKKCSVFYDLQKPEPEFKSLKEFHFIFNYFHSSFDGSCIALVLKHSFQLQKLEIYIKDSSFSTCFERLCKNKNISELREMEVYRYDSKEAQGLLSREMVDQVMKYCPYVYMVGGIESLETKNALSKIYSRITFQCMSQKLRNYCSAEHLKFLEDRVVFLDVSDLDDYLV